MTRYILVICKWTCFVSNLGRSETMISHDCPSIKPNVYYACVLGFVFLPVPRWRDVLVYPDYICWFQWWYEICLFDLLVHPCVYVCTYMSECIRMWNDACTGYADIRYVGAPNLRWQNIRGSEHRDTIGREDYSHWICLTYPWQNSHSNRWIIEHHRITIHILNITVYVTIEALSE